MTNIKDKLGGRPAKKRIEKQQRVVSTKLTELQFYAIRKLAGEANNINQLAHRANAGGFALVAVELVKLKNKIVEIINQLSDDWKNKKRKRI